MTKRASMALAGAALATLASGTARAELSTEPFMIRSAQDLVDLCAADPSDPLHDDAVNFCHGFVHGAWQYHQAQANGPKGTRLVCPPDPAPTRTDAIALFVDWARAHPQLLSEPGVETMFRFLIEKWPCPTTAAGTKGAPK